jgi:predicted nucleic acid-binding protein
MKKTNCQKDNHKGKFLNYPILSLKIHIHIETRNSRLKRFSVSDNYYRNENQIVEEIIQSELILTSRGSAPIKQENSAFLRIIKKS